MSTQSPRKWSGKLQGLRVYRQRSHDLGVPTRVTRNGDVHTLTFQNTGSMADVCAEMLDEMISRHDAKMWMGDLI